MEPSDLTFHTVSTSLRPSRIAVLLDRTDPDWMQSCLRIIEYTTQIWGGWYSCIVPTDGKSVSEEFWRLLEAFDPDYVYTYQKTMVDIKASRPSDCSQWVQNHVDVFSSKHPDESDPEITRQFIETDLGSIRVDPLEITGSLKKTILQRLNPFHHDEFVAQGRITAWPQSVSFPHTPVANIVQNVSSGLGGIAATYNVSIPSQLMFHSMTGKLWSGQIDQLAKQGVLIDRREFTPEELHAHYEALLEGKSGILVQFPRDLSLTNCALYLPRGRRQYSEPSIIVVGESVEDFCLYYCLSRVKAYVYWLPNSLLQSAKLLLEDTNHEKYFTFQNEESLLTKLSYHLYKDVEFERPQSKIAVTSFSLDDSELSEVAPLLDKAKLAGKHDGITNRAQITHDMEMLLPYAFKLYEKDNVDRITTEQFLSGECVDFLKTPKPQSFKAVPPHGHYWISEVRVTDYRLPQRTELGLAAVRHHFYTTEEIRISREGFCYLSPSSMYFGGDLDSVIERPKLKLLSPLEVFSHCFEAEGLSIKYSDKGNYHLHCISKFGSLELAASFFRDGTNRQVFDKYLDESASRDGEGVYCRERRYLDFVTIANITEDKARAEGLIDDLIQRHILHRGFLFHCESCRNADWYSIEVVGSSFTCSRCGTAQAYRKKHWKSPEEPRWYYKLDEVIYQGHNSNMYVPILALDKLRRESTASFFYIAEIEIRKDPSSRKPDLELDLCGCIDGTIFIGEATREDTLGQSPDKEKTRLAGHRQIADSLGAKTFVLATFADVWKTGSVALARQIFGEGRADLKLMTNSDLIG